MKVLVKTAISEYSGYGQDGIGLLQALIRAGHDVYVSPQHVDPPLPPDVVQLFGKRLEAPFDLLIQHQDPGLIGLTPEEMVSSEICVAATMWEFTDFSNLKNNKDLTDRLKCFDLILPYDDVTAGCFAPYIQDGGINPGQSQQFSYATKPAPEMRVLQGGYDPRPWTYAERDWSDDSRFGFCMVGMLHQRKDPWVSIQAFAALKRERPEFAKAELHLKNGANTLHPGMEAQYPGLKVHMGAWPIETMNKFYAAQHVLLAPSRGEGKNLPALEMLTTGGTVIATDWGGHTQWLREEYAYPLNYQLAPIAPEYETCLNARASVEHMKELMWHVFTHRDEARKKGKLGSQIIPATKSWDAYVANLMRAVAQVKPKRTSINIPTR